MSRSNRLAKFGGKDELMQSKMEAMPVSAPNTGLNLVVTLAQQSAKKSYSSLRFVEETRQSAACRGAGIVTTKSVRNYCEKGMDHAGMSGGNRQGEAKTQE